MGDDVKRWPTRRQMMGGLVGVFAGLLRIPGAQSEERRWYDSVYNNVTGEGSGRARRGCHGRIITIKGRHLYE